MPISEHAAAQEPSKLGLQPGDTISVDDAIKAIVTRSANDVAVDDRRGDRRRRKSFRRDDDPQGACAGHVAHALRNASGLPNDEQITTARDLTILARATEERFPRYFKYFSTHEFDYDGEIIGNHNHLLGRVDGVDGMKTGYTRASGFNLLTSVHRDGRSLVAVVLGGRTAGGARRFMEGLIRDHIAQASDRGHTAPMIAEAADACRSAGPARQPRRSRPARFRRRRSAPRSRPGRRRRRECRRRGDDRCRRNAAGRRPGPSPEAAPPVARPADSGRRQACPPPPQSGPSPRMPRRSPYAAASPQQLGWVKGPGSGRRGLVADAALAAALRAKARRRSPPRRAAASGRQGRLDHPDRHFRRRRQGQRTAGPRARPEPCAARRGARPFTEKVAKGEDVFYRARFAGLDSAGAETACRSLKKSGFACFAARD